MFQYVEYADIAKAIKIKCSGSRINILDKQRNKLPILFIEKTLSFKTIRQKCKIIYTRLLITALFIVTKIRKKTTKNVYVYY